MASPCDANIEAKSQPQGPEKPQSLGAALEAVIQHVGEMGLYQKLLFVGMLPFGVGWAFLYFGQMFIAATPMEHWCKVPELEGLDAELRRSLAIPTTADGYDHCNMFDANWTQVLDTLTPPPADTPLIPCQNGWEFLFDDIPYSTVVSEREWVCGKASLVAFAQAINFLGSIVGAFILGIMADKGGRVPVLVLANMFGCVGGVATVFTTGFWDFAVCRFIVGMSCDSLFLFAYILALEYVGTQYRTWVANLSIALFFGSGCMLLPWVALWVSDWRYFSLAISLPTLAALAAPFLMLESTRWLLSRRKIDRAIKVIKTLERINSAKIPQNVMDDFIHTAKTTDEKEQGVRTLFKIRDMRFMMIILILAFMSVALVFDGLIRLSENLGLDFFLTFTVSSAVEIPSIALLVVLLDRFGRRKLLFVPSLVCALLSFVAAFLQRGVATVTLAVVARFFINLSYGTMIQWTLELLPTAVRGTGAAFVHLSAFGAVVFTPFIVYSEVVWLGLSLVIVAAVALAGGCLALLLPETAGRDMPQTMDEWHQLYDSRQLRCCGKSKKSTRAQGTEADPESNTKTID